MDYIKRYNVIFLLMVFATLNVKCHIITDSPNVSNAGEKVIDDYRIMHRFNLVSYGSSKYIYKGHSGLGIVVTMSISADNFIESGRFKNVADSASRIVYSVVQNKEKYETLRVRFNYLEPSSMVENHYNVLYRIEGDSLVEIHHGTLSWP